MSGCVPESLYTVKKTQIIITRKKSTFFVVQKQGESPERYSAFHVIPVAKETFLHLCSVRHPQ